MTNKSKKILLIGDFIIDEFHYGVVRRIAKDAPIPIVDVSNVEMFSGGAGIIAETLLRLGVKKIMPVGIVGNDSHGFWLREKFARLGIPISNLIIHKDGKTSKISRIMVGKTQAARFDETFGSNLEKRDITKIIKILDKELKDTKIVIIADYGLGTMNKTIAEKIIEESLKKEIDVLVTSTDNNYLMYKNPRVIVKINLENSSILIKEPEINKIRSHVICKRLHNILESDRVLLTRGENGVTIYQQGDIVEMPATENKREDIKGIGEVMIAVMVTSLINSNDFHEACKLGNIAAGVAISKNNACLISKRDVLTAKKEYESWLGQK